MCLAARPTALSKESRASPEPRSSSAERSRSPGGERGTRAPVRRSAELGVRSYDMNARRYCDLVTVHIHVQRFRHVLHERSSSFGSQPSDFLRDRERGEMTGDKLRRQWKPRHLGRRTNANIQKAG